MSNVVKNLSYANGFEFGTRFEFGIIEEFVIVFFFCAVRSEINHARIKLERRAPTGCLHRRGRHISNAFEI